MRPTAAVVVPVVILFILFMGVVAPGRGAAQSPDPLIEAGRKIYEQQKCPTCHQIAKRGNSRFPLDGVGTRLTTEQIRRWMTDTAEMEAALDRMPAIRMSEIKFRLNSRELDALVAYLASLK